MVHLLVQRNNTQTTVSELSTVEVDKPCSNSFTAYDTQSRPCILRVSLAKDLGILRLCYM